MIRSILYATDLGLFAPYVLQHALALARTHAADLHVLHVVEPMGIFAESVLRAYLDETTLVTLRAGGLDSVMANIERQVFEGFRDELRENDEETASLRGVRVLLGDPPLVILQQAEELAVELIVVGSHSHSMPNNSIGVGRTCQRLLQEVRIPIYVVPIRPDMTFVP